MNWEEMQEKDKEAICKYLEHKRWIDAVADMEYDAYVNKLSIYKWKLKQMKEFEL